MSERNLNSVRSPSLTRGSRQPPILVIGLGNPILGDDGIGWRVAEAVRQRFAHDGKLPASDGGESLASKVDLSCLSLGGLSLMEHLIGYEKVIIIDAIDSGEYPKGTLRVFSLAELADPHQGHTASAHDTSLQTAIEVGRMMGAEITDDITVVSIESAEVYEFSEELSLPSSAAIPAAVEAVMELLSNYLSQVK